MRTRLPKKATQSHLTEVEQNIIYAIPFKDDVKKTTAKSRLSAKSYLPRKNPPQNNDLPEGFL